MKVFCWDFDGTLTHFDSLWGRSIRDILTHVLPSCPEELCQRVRKSMWGHYPWDTPERDNGSCRGELWWEHVGKVFYINCVSCGIPSALAEAAAKKLRAAVKQSSRYTLYPDAIPTLSALCTRGAKNILLSNNYPDLDEVMDALGLSPYFDGMVISGKVGYNKPRGEIFQLAKRAYPQAEYVMIGDNVTADILGGKQNGMTAVLVHKGFDAHADFCFDDLHSILSLANGFPS